MFNYITVWTRPEINKVIASKSIVLPSLKMAKVAISNIFEKGVPVQTYSERGSSLTQFLKKYPGQSPGPNRVGMFSKTV